MHADLTGTTLGKYELRELIGAGGMGAVYRAYDESLKREVAIKVVNLGTGGPELQARFIREAQTAAKLEHSHIVRVYDYGVERDINYVVMQYLNGGSLAERMRQAAFQGRSRASLPEIALLLEHLGSALDYAHVQGVIHRDIKPQNIMFNNHGQAFIVDFGIAKLLSDASNLTGTSTTIGTPSYMPPEQWGAETLTPTADQYALAVVTYQLVAGRLPFEADSVPSLWYKIEKEDATPLHIIRPDVSPSVMLVISRAMAKTPSERFPNCTQFAQAFMAAINGTNQDSAGDYFTFDLAKSPAASVPPFTTPPSTKALKGGALPDIPTTRPPVVQPNSPSAKGQSRAIYLVGLAGLLLAALLAVLFLNNAGGDSAAELTLTVVNQTLIAAGLATDDQATQNREAEETASLEPVASVATSETQTTVDTAAPPATATGENLLPTVSSAATENSAAPVQATPAPAVMVSPQPTDPPLASDTPAPTETATLANTLPAAASPVTPENTGTAIAIFNATQQAIFDATITGPGPETNNSGGTPAMFAPTESSAATIVITDALTALPTTEPTAEATEAPTQAPTATPSLAPTDAATIEPSATPEPTMTAAQATLPAVQAGALNTDWTPVEESFDGVPMVLVPSGCFQMGSEAGEPDELDPHEVCIDTPFWLDVTEVTQGQFAELAGVAARPPAFTGDLMPVEQISWFEARDFCAARGGRLPTEAEWEFAARGPESWIYPWGDELVGDNAIYADTSGGKTVEAGSRLEGASWVGALDMAGNVWEWTSSAYAPYPYDAEDGREIDLGRQTDRERIVRGGSWKTPSADLRAANRLDAFPVNTIDQIGFRCAYDFLALSD
jgi:serine/threonine protein kinase/formylglycine-generating enzyme required for sulfatase activity